MKLLITICARGGSKGVPNKNIRILSGKPLIGYTIETARKLKNTLDGIHETKIVLSTDSNQIKEVAAQFGLVTEYKRPDKLATDTAGKVDAITDVLQFSESKEDERYDYVLDMDVTAPLRTIQDLLDGLHLLEQDINAITLFSVSTAHRNPYFNMVEPKENGYIKLVKEEKKSFLARQSAPVVFDMNASFYYFRRAFFDQGYSTAITERSKIYLMPHTCFDIDSEVDFQVMEYLIREKKLGFKFP